METMSRALTSSSAAPAASPGPSGPASAERSVLVVLGCRLGETGTLCSAGRRRVAAAASAWHAGLAPVVIASGGRRWHGVAEADAMRSELLRLGVEADAVLRELRSLSTLENAWYSAEMMRRSGAVGVGVVTCDWHMPRALACFRRVGYPALGVPAQSAPVGRRRALARTLREALSMKLDMLRAASGGAPPSAVREGLGDPR